MFVGFIAVVVILLVIVGLMSSGSTSGSGGVDQTKATKVLTEVSALVQSAGFFQTTTTNSDYDGITVGTLETAGIIATADIADVSALTTLSLTPAADGTTDAADLGETAVVASKSVKGLYYNLQAASAGTSTFVLNTIVDTAELTAGDSLSKALESSYSKLDKGAVNPGVTGSDATDAAIVMTFK